MHAVKSSRTSLRPGGAIIGEFDADRAREGINALTPVAGGELFQPVEDCLCAIKGTLYEPWALARELGIDPDTDARQLVVAAYRSFGPHWLGRLRGCFALAIWDPRAARGMLACDQIGGEAMFLRAVDRRLSFASELRDLLRILPSRPAPDPVAMVHWLALGGPPSGHTFYEGVVQLPAGHCVELTPAGWRIERHWRPQYRDPYKVGFTQAAEMVRKELERAVRRRSGDGETTGVMLSGGIDSAAVAGIACAGSKPPTGAYSAVFPRHPQIDESQPIEMLSSKLALPSRSLPVTGGSVIAGAVRYIREWEVPATSPNLFFWSALLRQAAEDGVGTMLDGEGGDTLFWLSPYLLADRLTSGRLWSTLSLARSFPSDSGHVPAMVVARLIRDWGVGGAAPHRLHRLRRRLRGRQAFAPSWFSPASTKLRFDSDEELAWKREKGPRWWSFLLDSVTGVSSVMVHDAARRRNGSVGLAASHPLLDIDLIELMLSLPPELSFDPRLSRPLLRESVRGLIPDEVRLRPTKSSFDTLFHELLAGHELTAARSLLLAADSEVNAFIDPVRLRSDLFGAPPPRAPGQLQAWALEVWRLVTAECWLRHQAGRPLPTQ
jgi:asparagine synthase (glutamine-hydrolysing)